MSIEPAIPANNKPIGIHKNLLYSGSRFRGCQKSKGNSYEVEVVLQVRLIFEFIDQITLSDNFRQKLLCIGYFT